MYRIVACDMDETFIGRDHVVNPGNYEAVRLMREAGVRFVVDGAAAASYEGLERVVYVFDGRDEEAVAAARANWKAAKAAGCAVTYWQQSESGRWEQKA